MPLGFFTGQPAQPLTPQQLHRKRVLSDAFAEQAQTMPINNGWDGANAIAKTLASKWIDHQIAPQENAARQSILDALSGMNGSAPPPAGQMGSLYGAPSGAAPPKPVPSAPQPAAPSFKLPGLGFLKW